jgi:hypothetical protein
MRVCPVDLRPCVDDICHNSACLRSDGCEEMIEICPFCHEPIIGGDCDCEPDDDEYEEERT